jgi:hypothetical protein
LQKAYKVALFYYLLFSLLLLASSILLFDIKIGFSPQAVLEYYLGNEEKFIIAKTPAGILKLILPHILAYGLFIMVSMHFMIFTKYKNRAIVQLLLYTLFISGSVELFSPFLILMGLHTFALLKLISFVVFELSLLLLFGLLFKSIIYR